MRHSESLDLALANEGFPVLCIVFVHRLSTVNCVCRHQQFSFVNLINADCQCSREVKVITVAHH
jgi:hypothetical protein